MRVTSKPFFLMAMYAGTLAGFSCANKPAQLFFRTPQAAIPFHVSLPDYQIQPQDVVQIRNLQNWKYMGHENIAPKTQSAGNEGQTYEVAADGKIGLPILGQVKISGLSSNEAARYIETLYQTELRDPLITVKIISLKVTLLGEVRQQGVYPLQKEQTSLLEVLAAAGGLTDKGNSRNIRIIRNDPREPAVILFDLRNISTLSDPRILLRNNDVIYVSQNKKAIRSEKLQSIAAILQPILALLNTALIIHTLTR